MPDFMMGLAQALFGSVAGAVIALAVKPFKTRQEALRRFFTSCFFGALVEPMARAWMGFENTVEMRVAIGFVLAVSAWWLLGLLLTTLERRGRNGDLVDLIKDIKGDNSHE